MWPKLKMRVPKWMAPKDDIHKYISNGRRPWTRGYLDYRNAVIKSTINDFELMKSFSSKSPLPDRFGEYLDERVVEYPWLIANLHVDSAMILDAGSVLNFTFLLDHETLRNKNLHIVTLAPEEQCFWKRGISYLFSDLRSLPYADCVFDQVVCVSTLEHVGKNNAIYTDENSFHEDRQYDFENAVREMSRVCKKGGQLLLSVPFGRFTDFGWYQQFDSALLDRAIQAFGPADVDESFFRYVESGWTHSERASCEDCEGFNIHETKYFNPESNRDYDDDFAAASRGIAAIRLTKGG